MPLNLQKKVMSMPVLPGSPEKIRMKNYSRSVYRTVDAGFRKKIWKKYSRTLSRWTPSATEVWRAPALASLLSVIWWSL